MKNCRNNNSIIFFSIILKQKQNATKLLINNVSVEIPNGQIENQKKNLSVCF